MEQARAEELGSWGVDTHREVSERVRDGLQAARLPPSARSAKDFSFPATARFQPFHAQAPDERLRCEKKPANHVVARANLHHYIIGGG
jgi:hypothetical protein